MAVNALKGAFHAARRGPPEATGGLAVCFLAFLPLICHLKIITVGAGTKGDNAGVQKETSIFPKELVAWARA